MSTRMSRLAACAAVIFLVLSLLLLLLLPTFRKCFHGSTEGESRRSIVTSSPSAVKNYQRDEGAADLAHFRNTVSYIGSGNGSTSGDSYAVTSPDACLYSEQDADLAYYWYKFVGSAEGSSRRFEAQKELIDALSHRQHVQKSIELVGNILFGSEKGMQVLKADRPAGQPPVDDWDCLETMEQIFETYCGSRGTYDIGSPIANICNAGISVDKMRAACSQACKEFPSNPWSSIHSVYSA